MLEPITIDYAAINGYVNAHFKALKERGWKPSKDESLAELNCPEIRRLYEYQNIYAFKTKVPEWSADRYEEDCRNTLKHLGGATVKEVWDAIESIYAGGTYDTALAYFKRAVQEGIAAATTVARERVSKTAIARADQSRNFNEVSRIRQAYGLEIGAYVGTHLAKGQYERVADAHAVINRLYGQFTPYMKTIYAEVSNGAGGYLDKTAIEMLQRRVRVGSKSAMLALPIKVLAVDGLKVSSKQFEVIATYLPVPTDLKRGYIVATTEGNYVLAF